MNLYRAPPTYIANCIHYYLVTVENGVGGWSKTIIIIASPYKASYKVRKLRVVLLDSEISYIAMKY